MYPSPIIEFVGKLPVPLNEPLITTDVPAAPV
uniref:Uncharacterized protein n=1 Tax=viral metagenome TaxID=1070528 RepID=A0A6C0JK17_9ZZZZ